MIFRKALQNVMDYKAARADIIDHLQYNCSSG